MKWVKDSTGRFPQRPHYLSEELDAECEQIIVSFLQDRYGRVMFPVPTDDLTVLLEGSVDDLDLYSDLDGDTEGATDFFRGKKPKVQISRCLSESPHLENRLRTTLTHEFGHVRFHGFMFEIEPAQTLFPVQSASHSNRCKRENIVGAKQADWMEWQAGYACGAFLMPITAFRQTAINFLKTNGIATSHLGADTSEGQGLILEIATAFQVSKDAARVRLLQKGIVVEQGAMLSQSLFT